MKIVLLRTTHNPELGYEANALPKSYAKLGHKVFVVSTTANYAYKKTNSKYSAVTEKHDDYTLIRLPVMFKYYDFVLTKGIRKTLENIRPDVVILSMTDGLGAQASSYSKKIGFKVIAGQDQWDLPARGIKQFLSRLDYVLVRNNAARIVLKNSDCLVFTTLRNRSFFERYAKIPDGLKVKYIPFGADHTEFYPDKSQYDLIRKKLKIKEGQLVFTTAGGIYPLKKCEIFVRALKKDPELVFLAIGNGDEGYINHLKKLSEEQGVSERAIFLGRVEHTNLRHYYNASDALVWNRHTVGIMEAMACGVPVILPQIVADATPGYDGLSYKDDIIESFICTINNLKDKETWQKISKKSTMTAKEIYDYDKIAERYIRCLKR